MLHLGQATTAASTQTDSFAAVLLLSHAFDAVLAGITTLLVLSHGGDPSCLSHILDLLGLSTYETTSALICGNSW